MVNYKHTQQLHPTVRKIASGVRLAEYQAIFGHSALTDLKVLERDAEFEPVPWRIHRVEAWKAVMADARTSLEDRMGALR